MNLLIMLALAAGAALPVQAALNARLGRELGNPLLAALGSFVAGCIVLLLYLLITRTAFPTLGLVARIPPYLWIGGVLGGIYVALVIILTPRMGVATTMSLVVAGQLTMSLLLDHFGALGLTRNPITIGRLLGACLLAGGVILIMKR
jgi:transporter family-2 protein